jgi:hypothetical protein
MRVIVWFTLVLAVFVAGAAGGSEARPGLSYESGSMAFPVGDPDRGRLAFVIYRCTSCHPVSGDAGLPEPVAVGVAPELGGQQAGLKACELAESIVSPSQRVDPAVLARADGELSPMGDLSETMTVRQLIDLVAYLKSLRSGAEPERIATAAKWVAGSRRNEDGDE